MKLPEKSDELRRASLFQMLLLLSRRCLGREALHPAASGHSARSRQDLPWRRGKGHLQGDSTHSCLLFTPR